ncbi:ABC transporter permease [Paractinoplanes atraurantiacus]|uniref:ABC-2 type transport system permease protein n=1 Tax=Paractinoplanes atraurantiacus TaxID=1036182 RepID=A0A285K8U5_9ACTN|nr:ABC transporter permease [Actinoplanes atraurantiacus]SNY68663.1 ABC-2 type transport system permease protein [Actinoplanes atraurantiacus]
MTGTGPLLRFLLRRERRSLPWWLLGVTLLVLVQSTQSQSLYGTPEALQRLRDTIGANNAVIAMSGPTDLLVSIGGEIVFEIFAFAVVVVALMNMFLIGRHTRADEESGRAELLRSARVGRHAPLAAALLLALLADVAAGLLVFAVAAGTGLPVAGSALFGAAITAAGLVFAAAAAVAAQVFESTRAVYGTVAALLGAAFALRAAGDVGSGALSWASPIGWGQRTLPFAGDRWWPILLSLAVAVLLGAVAVALLTRRDFGAGLVATRLGRGRASAALRNPYALAWRLQRGSVAGWVAGLLLLGVAYGSIGDSIEQYVRDNPEIAQFLTGGAAEVLNAYLAVTAGMAALLAAAYGVTSVLRARAEETSGRAEVVLATPVSRATWLAGQLGVALPGTALTLVAFGFGEGLAYGMTVSDPSQVPRLVGVALAYVPAVWLIVGVTVLAFGWLPRPAAIVAWAVIAYCAVITLFADSFDLPGWSRQASPFAHTPQVPLDEAADMPLLALTLLAAALTGAGYAGLRRRDVGY